MLHKYSIVRTKTRKWWVLRTVCNGEFFFFVSWQIGDDPMVIFKLCPLQLYVIYPKPLSFPMVHIDLFERGWPKLVTFSMVFLRSMYDRSLQPRRQREESDLGIGPIPKQSGERSLWRSRGWEPKTGAQDVRKFPNRHINIHIYCINIMYTIKHVTVIDYTIWECIYNYIYMSYDMKKSMFFTLNALQIKSGPGDHGSLGSNCSDSGADPEAAAGPASMFFYFKAGD